MKFSDTRFMSADEKGQVLSDWNRFLVSGFSWPAFTDRLYKHLTLNCSFISHYDRQGFYSFYFEDEQDTASFMRQFMTGISTEYGFDYWLDGEYRDLNLAMCRTVRDQATGISNSLSDLIVPAMRAGYVSKHIAKLYGSLDD